MGPIFGSGCPSVSEGCCVDLTDVTLADEDTNSKLTDNAKRAIQGNEAMQVMQVMQAMQVMQVMPVMQVMQVVQVIQVMFCFIE